MATKRKNKGLSKAEKEELAEISNSYLRGGLISSGLIISVFTIYELMQNSIMELIENYSIGMIFLPVLVMFVIVLIFRLLLEFNYRYKYLEMKEEKGV